LKKQTDKSISKNDFFGTLPFSTQHTQTHHHHAENPFIERTLFQQNQNIKSFIITSYFYSKGAFDHWNDKKLTKLTFDNERKTTQNYFKKILAKSRAKSLWFH